MLHCPDDVDGEALQVVNIYVPVSAGQEAFSILPEAIYLGSKCKFQRLVDQLDLGDGTLLPLKHLEVFDRATVRICRSRFTIFLSQVFLPIIDARGCFERLLKLVSNDFCSVFLIELEDLVDLKVGEVDLSILYDQLQLLELIEFAQCFQVVEENVDRALKNKCSHETFELLHVDSRFDSFLQAIHLCNCLLDNEAESFDFDDAASTFLLELVEVQAKGVLI